MAREKPAKLNGAAGFGYAETFRNSRGGRQGEGRMRITSGGAELHNQLVKGEKTWFTGTVYDAGREVEHTFSVAVRRFTSDSVTFVAEWDPLADYVE